jgi:VanZ family protein
MTGNNVDDRRVRTNTLGNHPGRRLPPSRRLATFHPAHIPMKPRAITAFRILSVLYAVLVSIVSSWPSIRLPDLGIDWTDKFAHFAQYALFACLVAGGWARAGGWRAWKTQWRPVLFLLLFAAVDELHQLWIPRREASFLDWTADCLGILFGFAVGLILWRRSSK